MIKRNLKLFNHWLAEVRDLARNRRPRLRVELPDLTHSLHGVKLTEPITGRTKPMPYADIKYVFCKDVMETYFKEGMEPKEALEEEISNW